MLFIILIAVALFAALAYVMVSEGKGSQSMLTTEQARLAATDIIQYGDSLRPIIDRMMLLNGVLDTDTPAGSGILFQAAGVDTTHPARELLPKPCGMATLLLPERHAG